MSEKGTSNEEKGYETIEYSKEDGGKVGSLSSEELQDVLSGVNSKTMAEEIHRNYIKVDE